MIMPGGENPYFTNSTHLPVNTTEDVFEALDYPGGLACLCLESSVVNLGTWQEYSDWMTSQGHNVQHLIGGKE